MIIMMIDSSMTRWELLQAFRKIAVILFMEMDHSDASTIKLRRIVLDVLVENNSETPVFFGSGEDKNNLGA